MGALPASPASGYETRWRASINPPVSIKIPPTRSSTVPVSRPVPRSAGSATPPDPALTRIDVGGALDGGGATTGVWEIGGGTTGVWEIGGVVACVVLVVGGDVSVPVTGGT